MKNTIYILILALVMVGCASNPAAPTKKTDVPVPTYVEKITSVGISDYKTNVVCPQDEKWEGMEWRKVTAMANACVKAKDWRKVEMLGDYLAKRAHLTPWGAYFLSLAAHTRKDYPRANWMLELALKKAPNEGLFHYQLGRLHWDAGDDTAALKEIKLASDLSPGLVDAHYVTGYMALQRDDHAEAERRLRKALSTNPQHLPSTLAMATLRMNSKDWVNAEVTLVQALRLNPRSTRVRLTLAQVREQHLKKLQEALYTYKELRTLIVQKKADEASPLNLDEKILVLEKNISQAGKENQLVRKPSADGKVSQ